ANSKEYTFAEVSLQSGLQDVEAFLGQADQQRGVHQIYITKLN
ncbi:MAG: hypothetical protein ACJASX_001736, partial [Limisphaerales bacterium]